ncbi:NAD(P)-binding protein [Nocardia higoensis]|uniref:NAD(P)-binding protein n=1 Tax=Nocardia higoensis TaxID=228599 RepID=UPI001C3F3ED8
MARIIVVGGEIAGSAVALFLDRRGHQVAVLEKDGRSAGADLESDFFDWRRPGVPQATQPHSLLALDSFGAARRGAGCVRGNAAIGR